MRTTTWSALTEKQRKDIVHRVLEEGEDTEVIAKEYELRVTSLDRTMRRIRQQRGLARVRDVEQGPKTSIVQETATYTSTIIGDMTLGSNPELRTMYLNTSKPLRMIAYADTHFSRHDELAISALIRAIGVLPHDLLVNLGDTFDMHGLSKFGKDPRGIFSSSLTEERKAYIDFANRVKENTDKPSITIFGNHMLRYIYWMHDNPSVMQLPELQIDNIMQLEKYGWHPNVGSVFFNANMNDLDFPNPELVIHHGQIHRKHSGNSSRIESEMRGYISSISGHIHRLSVAYKKTMSGQILMAECGTLRTLRPEYLKVPDWQHGFIYLTFVPGIGTFAEPLLIVNGELYHNGERI